MVYVDLSAKVEQWVRNSAVVMANDQQQRACLVPRNVKQKNLLMALIRADRPAATSGMILFDSTLPADNISVCAYEKSVRTSRERAIQNWGND